MRRMVVGPLGTGGAGAPSVGFAATSPVKNGGGSTRPLMV